MALANAPSIPRPRAYRRFLTSAFHTRFVHAALLSFFLALDAAFWLGQKNDFFWSWFPVGPAGLKALLFFMTSLFTFILLIATLKVGRQTPLSPISNVLKSAVNLDTVQILFWYSISAWWFSEVYIWSSPDLGWVTKGNLRSTDKLNEQPIYVRAYFLMLACVQAGSHVYLGHSWLHITVLPVSRSQTNDHRTHPVETIISQLKRTILQVSMRFIIIAGMTTVGGPFIYTPFLRQTFWKVHLVFAKPFFNISRANAYPSGFPPLGLPFIFRTFRAGLLLSGIWELTWLLFITYLKQEPIKKGLPLTASSKDPNGTLLNGLKAKRDIVKTFAFWELAIIAQKHPDRRKAIFSDIERPNGPIWSQMLQAALEILLDTEKRVLAGLPSPVAPGKTNQQALVNLPKIVPETRKQSVFAAEPPPSTTGQMVKGFVSQQALRKLGSPANPWHPPIEDAARLLEYDRTPSTGPGSQNLLEQRFPAINASPIAWLFKSTNAALINSTVLGTPSGNAALIVDAIEAMTKMLVSSLTEDNFGKAAGGVPETVKIMTRVVNTIEMFIGQDSRPLDGTIGEVEIVVSRLRAGLRELLSAFQMYLADVGLSIEDLNKAKKASEQADLVPYPAPTPVINEMEQVKETGDQPVQRQLFPKSTSTRGKQRTQGESFRGQSTAKESRPLLSAPKAQSSGLNATVRQKSSVPIAVK